MCFHRLGAVIMANRQIAMGEVYGILLRAMISDGCGTCQVAGDDTLRCPWPTCVRGGGAW
jgi:hypothetical protein